MELPNKEDTVIIHYGCSDFKKPEHIIFWVGAVYFNQGQKEYFFEDGEEIEIIKKLKGFVEEHKDKTFIHWSMEGANYGFTAIERRYKELDSKGISIVPAKKFDLSEYLKEKYGVNYVPRDGEGGRLNQLAKLNSFSGYKNAVEVEKRNEASDRLELLYSICQAERQGKLKTLSSCEEINPFPRVFISYEVYKKFLEYTDKHILEPYIDYSYLKKRLEKKKLIYRLKDKEFIEFLHLNKNTLTDRKYLSEREYEMISEKDGLYSLGKSTSEQRENNFNNIFS